MPLSPAVPMLDCHIHFGHPALAEGLFSVLDQQGISACNIVCTPHRSRLSLVPDALYLKAQRPARVFVFGGLDISALFMAQQRCGEIFAGYLDTLVEMGCDGVKMIEGKPDMRKNLPVPPFDGSVYAPYWEKLEESGLPLIFHVNDPPEFWDASLVPDWARQQGWFYGDGSYINNEAQYTEVLNVLRRHPKLKTIFAHFFFLSGQLARLADYLDEFPGMHVDLTPGIEMYHIFSRQPQATRDFFMRYQERILYGTDIGAKALLSSPQAGIEPDESNARAGLVRKFLETDGPFEYGLGQGFLFGKFAGQFHGLGLPGSVLDKIYHANFERLAGSTPRPLNPAAIVGECRRLTQVIPIMGAAQPGQAGDVSVAQMVSDFFTKEIQP